MQYVELPFKHFKIQNYDIIGNLLQLVITLDML